MAEYKKRSVSLQKYNIDAYNGYVILLSKAVEQANWQGDTQTVSYLLDSVTEILGILEQVEAETDTLAYKIKDIPDFEPDAQVQNYIKQAASLKAK